MFPDVKLTARSSSHPRSSKAATEEYKLHSQLNLSKMKQSHVTGSIPQSQGCRAGKLTRVDDVSLLSPPGELPYLLPASPLTPCSFHTLPHPSICTKFQLLPLSFFHILPILSPPLPFSVKGETASMEGGEHVTSFQEAECLLYPYCPSLS